jgi:hypothetical protein
VSTYLLYKRVVRPNLTYVGQAYFEGNTIAIAGSGAITANGRSADDVGICEFRKAPATPDSDRRKDLFNRNTIVAASGSSGVSGNYFFGRPWRGVLPIRLRCPCLWILTELNRLRSCRLQEHGRDGAHKRGALGDMGCFDAEHRPRYL